MELDTFNILREYSRCFPSSCFSASLKLADMTSWVGRIKIIITLLICLILYPWRFGSFYTLLFGSSCVIRTV